jgi:NAD(P)H-dependent flavin oxidoreductase YrpB (nitropropane dioxygenase family)
MLGVGRLGADALTTMIDEAEAATDRSIGAGFITEFADEAALQVAFERLSVVEFFWGWPDPALVPDGPVVGWQVGSVDAARAAVDAGCRYVAVQGLEAGGHVRGEVELDHLLADVRDALGADIVVAAGGGIGTAGDVRRVLAAGADAVRIGTRFVATHESAAHDRYVELLAGATDADTELSEAFWVGWPEALHRVLTSAVEASGDADDVIGSMPGPGDERRIVPRFFVSPPTRAYDGLIDAMALYAGTGSTGAVTGRQSAAEVVADLLGDGV